ncbi:transposase, partial [Pseudoalteromonas sp. 20-MNA-CIBAN-0454]|uniref:transposase n=1 Tax=Pseudoalteromonas sp. 20-MNA-CIBAN-0454 TaxID=3140424 RepID=UPI0033166C69
SEFIIEQVFLDNQNIDARCGSLDAYVYFKYPDYVRKAIYTTNAIEAVHRQFRRLTKTKGGFPNENSLMKLLYAGILNASKKWTMPIHNWNLTLSQLAIHFEGRLDGVLDI